MESHLLQMRGLKRQFHRRLQPYPLVASFTDAWIETTGTIENRRLSASHLLQMRGLKLGNSIYL